MTEAGKSNGLAVPAPSVLRRLDDGIFAVEQAVVTTFLSAMTVMVFLDVVYRRLVAPDSKLGHLLALIFRVHSDEGRATLDHTVAPILGVVLGVSALGFGFWTAERRAGAANAKRALLRTILASAALGGLGYLMVLPSFSSRAFYILLFALGGGSYAVSLLRARPRGFALKLGALAVTAALFVPFALRYFPQGYTWSKEVSLMLLLWVGFLGASVCAHEGKHIRMEALGKLVPARLQRFARAFGFALAALFCAFMALLGWQYTFDPTYGAYFLGGIFEQTGIPDWLAIAAVPVAFGLTALRFTAVTVSTLRGGSYGAPISEEEELTGASHMALSDVEEQAEPPEDGEGDDEVSP
ncbi:MAG: TRAP transporter small permease [Deltaproteobacteria bacterium]|nr:TRAP transporter small permease [Deltaproteobacteria bacterium]